MPLFNKKSNKLSATTANGQQYQENNNLKSTISSPIPSAPQASSTEKKNGPSQENNIKNQLVFHCQLAHGSPTGLICGFSSVKELYQKIAECYDFSVDEVSLTLCL